VVFFNLWNNGGPAWQSEYKRFLSEEHSSWFPAPAGSSKSRHPPSKNRTFADAVRFGDPSPSRVLSGANSIPLGKQVFSNSILTGANAVKVGGPAPKPSRISVHDRLVFPMQSRANGPKEKRCTRCLSTSHWRIQCRERIRCRACWRQGHIEAACINAKPIPKPEKQRYVAKANGKESAANCFGSFKGDTVPVDCSGWFKGGAVQASSSSPPRFNSFEDMSRFLWPNQSASPPIVLPWASKPINLERADLASEGRDGSVPAVHPRSWRIFTPGSSSPPPSPHCTVQTGKNPNSSPAFAISGLNAQAQVEEAGEEAMALQRADPSPFIPEHLEHVDVPNRRCYVKAVAPVRPLARNEMLAIATFNPLPGNAMHFPAIRAVLRDFLRHEVRVHFEDIQPTSLGQALVRFTHGHVRDVLVEDSPHVFDNVTVSFVNHDQGKNWRSAEFNHECWILLLDFPSD